MFGIKYFKAEPTEFARMKAGGKTSKEGVGISGFFMPFRTTLELVPLTASDQPFAFPEVTSDKQEVAFQGGIVYRIVDPQKVMAQYSFAVNPVTRAYLTEDPQKIPQHILQLVRGEAKAIVQATPLEEVLVRGKSLATDITSKLSEMNAIPEMGIEFRNLYFDSITPNPAIAKALEADYRESLLQKADAVIYARRVQAVENERKIREEEMKTDTQMEQGRKQLVELQGQNVLREAEDNAKAVEIGGIGKAKTVQVIGEAKAGATQKRVEAYSGVDPIVIAALTLSDFGRQAKFGDITVTPELLASLGTAVKYVMSQNGGR